MGRLACVNVSLSPQTGVAAPENAAGGRVDFVCERLCGFSPKVEPRQMEPGIFWLSADGLEAVYPSLTHWALLLQTDLAAAGFETTVALGFDRFYTYALAKSAARLYPDSPLRIRVLHSRAEEARAGTEAIFVRQVLQAPAVVRTSGDARLVAFVPGDAGFHEKDAAYATHASTDGPGEAHLVEKWHTEFDGRQRDAGA